MDAINIFYSVYEKSEKRALIKLQLNNSSSFLSLEKSESLVTVKSQYNDKINSIFVVDETPRNLNTLWGAHNGYCQFTTHNAESWIQAVMYSFIEQTLYNIFGQWGNHK